MDFVIFAVGASFGMLVMYFVCEWSWRPYATTRFKGMCWTCGNPAYVTLPHKCPPSALDEGEVVE